MRPPSRRRGHGTPREISAGRDDDDEAEGVQRPSSDEDADAATVDERSEIRRLCLAWGGLRGQAAAQVRDDTHLARLSRGKHRAAEGAAAAAEEEEQARILFEVFRRVALPRFEFFFYFSTRVTTKKKKTRAATRSHRPTGKGQSSFSLPHSLDAIHHASVDGLGLLWRLPPQLAGRAQLEEDVHRVRREEKRIYSVRSNRDHRFSVEKRILFSTSCFLR